MAKLVDGLTFTVREYKGYMWKQWQEEEKTFKTEKGWFEGAQKQYSLKVDIKDGAEDEWLNPSQGQMGSMVMQYFNDGKCDIIDKEFTVKTNGKEGMEIRYYFNRPRTEQSADDII